VQRPLAHSSQHWLQTFSARLPKLVAPSHSLLEDPQVALENLHYNLADTLALLISELTLVDRSLAAFEAELQQFNQQYGSTINWSELAARGWVRLINEEVWLPESVSSFVWRLERAVQKGQPTELAAPLDQELTFLTQFNEKYHADITPVLPAATLDRLLATYSSSRIDKEYLLKKDIIRAEADQYRWIGGHYVHSLSTEIATRLWLLINPGEVTVERLRYYMRLLLHAEIWSTDILQHLPTADAGRLRELATCLRPTQGACANWPLTYC
jgi:hypothetical protein